MARDERRVGVELKGGGADRSYAVRVGAGVLGRGLSEIGSILGKVPERAFVVLDTGLPGGVRAGVERALKDAGARDVVVESFEPTERAKTIGTLGRLLESMVSHRLERRDPVIAVGGGIVGDVAGYAAASYRRGVPVIQCPTTLLSMVDASVGGKTGINVEVGGSGTGGSRLVKNMAGAFWQPAAVLADVTMLASLSARDFRCGLAECLKHGMLGGFVDAGLAAWMEASMASILAREPSVLTELVARNVAVKAAVVRSDEREEAATGGRALLNLGHTYTHAIEPMAHLSPTADAGDAPLRHGEAVGLGLIAATGAGAALGLVAPQRVDEVRSLVASTGLPARVAGLPGDDRLIDAMGDDKKVSGGRLRIVVPDGAGRCRVVEGPDPGAVRAGWSAIRDG